MINQFSDFLDLLDSESLTDERIELLPDQIDRAAQLSQSIPHSPQQWQTYIHALALFGLKQWLEEWAPDLDVDDSRCSIFQPAYANLIEAVCHLHVGRFHVCLIATTSLMSPAINLPKAVIDLPQFVPHFYVLVEVWEEQMQAQIYGYLRRDQLIYRQSDSLETADDWTYAVPLSWFNADPSALLLELRCLDPEALCPLTVSSHSIPADQPLQARLPSLLPQLRSPRSLSQILMWEEGAIVLTNPELVNWIYQVQNSDTEVTEPLYTCCNPPSSILRSPANPTSINVGNWLSDRLDDAARRLGWILLPPIVPASALRSTQEQLETVGIHIPPETRGAYQDLQLGNAALRLYAATWVLSPTIETFEWTLLIILAAQPSTHLPVGIRLQVRDEADLLFEQVLEGETEDSSLYAQVGGGLEDQFWVAINLPDGATITLPPFIFNSSLGNEE